MLLVRSGAKVWKTGSCTLAVYGTLELADQLNLASVAFPAISTGIFGFPKERAARIMLEAIRSYFSPSAGSKVQVVRIVLIDSATLTCLFRRLG